MRRLTNTDPNAYSRDEVTRFILSAQGRSQLTASENSRKTPSSS